MRNTACRCSGTADIRRSLSFLTEIPSDRIVETDWGAELYCIYPRRADAVVAVNACGYEESEENGYDLVVGEMLFESRSGAPFLLRCNISDIMYDCQVSIFNPDGTVLTWSPAISLNDGSVILPQEGPSVYDASRKPEADYGGTDYGDTDYGIRITAISIMTIDMIAERSGDGV